MKWPMKTLPLFLFLSVSFQQKALAMEGNFSSDDEVEEKKQHSRRHPANSGNKKSSSVTLQHQDFSSLKEIPPQKKIYHISNKELLTYMSQAEKGYAEAQYKMALIQLSGEGSGDEEKARSQALEWLEKARAQNHLKALELLEDLKLGKEDGFHSLPYELFQQAFHSNMKEEEEILSEISKSSPQSLADDTHSRNQMKEKKISQRKEEKKLPVLKPLSFSDSLNVSGILYGPELQAGLTRLKDKILKATQAEEDIYYQVRESLKAHHKVFAHLSSLFDENVEQILPPEEALRPLEDELITDEKLQVRDDKFLPIYALLKRLKTFETKAPPSVLNLLKKVQKAYNDFIENFCRSSVREKRQLLEKRAILRGEGIGRYLIPASIGRDLLSKDLCGNDKKRDQEGGQSRVTAKGGVHFKVAESSISNIDPAMEWAAYALSILYWGPGYIPPSATLILEDVPFFKEKYKEKIALKKEVQRINKKIADNPQYALTEEEKSKLKEWKRIVEKEGKKIDEGERALTLFSEKVIYPEKPITIKEFWIKYPKYHQFFFESETGGIVQTSETSGEISLYEFFQKVDARERGLEDLNLAATSGMFLLSRLARFTDMKDDNVRLVDQTRPISIDNDRIFGNEIVKHSEKHFIEIKNVLPFLSPFMKQTPPLSIRERGLTPDCDLYPLCWLWMCDQQNQRYQSLHGEKKGWRIGFQKGTSLHLKQDVKILQEALWDKSLTHQKIFHKFSPIATAFYQALAEKYSDPHKAQEVLWKAPYIEDVIKDEQLLRDLELYTAKPGEYEQDRTQSPQDEARDLLETVDLHEKNKTAEVRLKLLMLAHDWLSWPFSWKKENKIPWNKPESLFLLAKDILTADFMLKEPYSKRRQPLLKTILSCSAFNPQQKETEGNTLLHLWAKSSLHFDEELLKDAEEKGWNKNWDLKALNAEGLSPFDSAMKHNPESLLLALLKQEERQPYQEAILEEYYHKARDTQKWKTSIIRKLFKARKEKDPHFAWVLKRTKFLCPTGPGEKVEILTYNPTYNPGKEGHLRVQKEERFLDPKLKSQLWPQDGTFNAIHTNGSRMVGRVILKEEHIKKTPSLLSGSKNHNRLYFKRFPSFPGMAIAISFLQEEFFEDGFLPLTFAKIKDEPFLISPGIGRLRWNENEKRWEEIDNLQYVLEKDPERLKGLDPVATAKLTLTAELTNPEDGKPSNYVLERLPNGKDRPMDIDPEQAFVPAVAKPPKETGGLIVQMKTVLFCFDNMNDDTPEEVEALITRWNIFPQAERWVHRLIPIDEGMKAMFEGKIEKLFTEKESYIGIPFQKGEIKELVGKLIKLQQFFEEPDEEKDNYHKGKTVN